MRTGVSTLACLEPEGECHEWDLQELRDDIEHSIDFAVDAESRLISFTRSLVAAQI